MTDVGINTSRDWILSASKDATIRLWNIAESDKITASNDTKKTFGLRVSTVSRCIISYISSDYPPSKTFSLTADFTEIIILQDLKSHPFAQPQALILM